MDKRERNVILAEKHKPQERMKGKTKEKKQKWKAETKQFLIVPFSNLFQRHLVKYHQHTGSAALGKTSIIKCYCNQTVNKGVEAESCSQQEAQSRVPGVPHSHRLSELFTMLQEQPFSCPSFFSFTSWALLRQSSFR